MLFTVYALLEPDDEEIRYVGVTCQTLEKRLQWHLIAPANTHLVTWLANLQRKGKVPRIKALIENIPNPVSAKRIEEEQIALHKGFRLLNIKGNILAMRSRAVKLYLHRDLRDRLY